MFAEKSVCCMLHQVRLSSRLTGLVQALQRLLSSSIGLGERRGLIDLTLLLYGQVPTPCLLSSRLQIVQFKLLLSEMEHAREPRHLLVHSAFICCNERGKKCI